MYTSQNLSQKMRIIKFIGFRDTNDDLIQARRLDLVLIKKELVTRGFHCPGESQSEIKESENIKA